MLEMLKWCENDARRGKKRCKRGNGERGAKNGVRCGVRGGGQNLCLNASKIRNTVYFLGMQ